MQSRIIKYDRRYIRTTMTSSGASSTTYSEFAVQSCTDRLVDTIFEESQPTECAIGCSDSRLTLDQATRLSNQIEAFEKAHSCNMVLLIDEYVFNTRHEDGASLIYTSEDFSAFGTYTVTAEWGVISETSSISLPFEQGCVALFKEIESDIRWNRATRAETSMPSGDMLLSPKACGLLIHEFIGHMLEEDNYRHSPLSLLDCVKMPSALSIIENYRSEVLFDDMGYPVERAKSLIRDGELVGLLGQGNYRKGSIHRHPIPRMRDMFIRQGHRAEGALKSSIEEGVYVEKIDSGEMNHLTGDFSVMVSHSARITNGNVIDILPKFTLFFSVESFCGANLELCSDVVSHKTLCGKEGSFVPIDIRSPACLISDFAKVAHYG